MGKAKKKSVSAEIREFAKKNPGMSHADIAKHFGKAQGHVSGALNVGKARKKKGNDSAEILAFIIRSGGLPTVKKELDKLAGNSFLDFAAENGGIDAAKKLIEQTATEWELS